MEPMRDDPGMRAIARLWARLDAYRRDELVQLLSPEALDDLHPVQRLMADPEGPVQTRALALSAVTWFHWCRYHLLTGERAERELRMALAAGAQAAAVSPALVPPDALAMVRSGSLLADPAIEADRAGRRVTLAGQTGDQTALNEALASLARAVAGRIIVSAAAAAARTSFCIGAPRRGAFPLSRKMSRRRARATRPINATFFQGRQFGRNLSTA